jgi:hypothetical protein
MTTYLNNNLNMVTLFQKSYAVAGTESSRFDVAMWLPEWVNIEEGARQSTPLEEGETAGENAEAGSLFFLLSVAYPSPSYTSTAYNKS